MCGGGSARKLSALFMMSTVAMVSSSGVGWGDARRHALGLHARRPAKRKGATWAPSLAALLLGLLHAVGVAGAGGLEEHDAAQLALGVHHDLEPIDLLVTRPGGISDGCAQPSRCAAR